ncbi:MAG: N-acetylmuramoyl-L-alanine amidase [Oscillospiraceae bacterium]|nr:N-acetylmuramoyl-L-alanine amidase [Oscillospiraceae bacterium]
MPTIYLSPSTQEGNQYVTGNSEEYWMNRIADAMEPYLRASGIDFVRNTPQMTAVTSIRQSNAGNYDLHLALHSNAAPEGQYGEVQGTDVYYYPGSSRGERAAELIADGLRQIYPLPRLVRTLPTTRLGEVRQPKAPSAFIEFAYHDNEEDARWITENINEIAANVVQSLAKYFGLPFLQPEQIRTGTVRTDGGRLNMRAKPSLDGEIIARIPNGASVIVYGQTGDWLVGQYGGRIGYLSSDYVQLY